LPAHDGLRSSFRRLRQARRVSKIAAIRYAREHGVPYLGICLGMQLAVIEYARHKTGLARQQHEFDQATPHPVVALITEWQNRDGRSSGATSRPTSAARCALARNLATSSRDRLPIASTDRQPCRSGTVIATKSTIITCRGQRRPRRRLTRSETAGDLCEMIELPDHPWFFGCQFHPEFTSNPRRGHPLFLGFVNARSTPAGACVLNRSRRECRTRLI
jgi:CTP synthase